MKRALRNGVTYLLITAFVLVTFQDRAFAEIVPTGQALAMSQNGSDGRRYVSALLARDDVRQELARAGLDPAEVDARVNALSDAEIDMLAGRLDTLPAGGDGLGTIVGAILLVFFVLLLTDILGLTKVYPFTRSVR